MNGGSRVGTDGPSAELQVDVTRNAGKAQRQIEQWANRYYCCVGTRVLVIG